MIPGALNRDAREEPAKGQQIGEGYRPLPCGWTRGWVSEASDTGTTPPQATPLRHSRIDNGGKTVIVTDGPVALPAFRGARGQREAAAVRAVLLPVGRRAPGGPRPVRRPPQRPAPPPEGLRVRRRRGPAHGLAPHGRPAELQGKGCVSWVGPRVSEISENSVVRI